MELEAELESRNPEKPHLWQHFDLICGTSTGGIIALALALGIPAAKIHKLYLDKAGGIFSEKRGLLSELWYAAYSKKKLVELLKEYFEKNGQSPKLQDCKTQVCIPVYDLFKGEAIVMRGGEGYAKEPFGEVPAYQVATATAAAPTFFAPTAFRYKDSKGIEHEFWNKVDGGVFANNPTMIGVLDAQTHFGLEPDQLSVLSIGTGSQKFKDARVYKKWGILYWIKPKKKRIINLFMQGQSQQVQNSMQLLASHNLGMEYLRVDLEMDENSYVKLDEVCSGKLRPLSEKAEEKFRQTKQKALKISLS